MCQGAPEPLAFTRCARWGLYALHGRWSAHKLKDIIKRKQTGEISTGWDLKTCEAKTIYGLVCPCAFPWKPSLYIPHSDASSQDLIPAGKGKKVLREGSTLLCAYSDRMSVRVSALIRVFNRLLRSIPGVWCLSWKWIKCQVEEISTKSKRFPYMNLLHVFQLNCDLQGILWQQRVQNESWRVSLLHRSHWAAC